MAGILDRCMFTPTSGGTGTWTVSAAVTGYMTPASAGAVNATVYYYFAENSSKTEWEVGSGTYTVSGTTLTRTPLFSSNSNAAVNFTNPPNVGITLLAENLGTATAAGLAFKPGLVGPLEQHTASASASLDFTTAITSTYDEYVIEFLNVVLATAGEKLHMRMSTDGGATYDATANYSWFIGGWTGSGAGQSTGSSPTTIQLVFSPVANTSTKGISGTLRLFNPLSTSLHTNVSGDMNYLVNTSNLLQRDSISGWYNSTTAVNALRFLSSSGNITSGTILIYGLTH